MQHPRLAAPVRWSVHLYRFLLHVFPAAFRNRFGRETTEAFHDAARAAWRAGGITSLSRLWIRTFVDLGFQGLSERLRRHRDAGRLLSRRPSTDKAGIMDRVLQDVRFAVRTLQKSPGFTAAVIATIALGIGANTAIFTVVDGIILRPLPFPDSDRVVSLCETHARVGDYCVTSFPNAADWAQMSESLDAVGVARTWTYSVRRQEDTVSIRSGIATPGFFAAYGQPAVLGRLLEPNDLVDGGNQVVILTHGFWQQQFNGSPDVLGEHLVMDAKPFTVIGVLPPDAWFHDFNAVQMWTPLTATPDNPDQRGWRGFTAIGRLATGATLTQAREEMAGIRDGLERQYPFENEGWGIQISSLRDRVAGPAQSTLLLFLGAVGFVLLIGCANVANLMLVRATERTQEFAVRASLGAGRRRLVRQLLTESLLLAALGGLLGVSLANGATRLFLTLAPDNIPRLDEVGIDLRALGFAMLLVVTTAMVFGLAPAWRAARTDLNETLKASRHGDVRAGGARRLLVIGEIALALILLVGAGLLTRSFTNLLDWNPGFDRTGLVTTWGLANFSKVESTEQINDLFDEVAREIEALPGVSAVGMTSAGPLFGGRETELFSIAGRPETAADERPALRWYDIDPGYFGALGTTLTRGRNITYADDGGLPVAVINETFARRHFPDESPLGHRIVLDDYPPVQVVGVVPDMRPFEPTASVGAEIYWPKRQFPRGATYFVIRSELGLEALQRQVSARLEPLEGLIDLRQLTPYERLAEQELVSPLFNMVLVAIFAGVAMTLAAIGTYGVLAYTVISRTHEIGIRIAVGANPRRIMATVLRSGMSLALIGMGIGLAGAALLSRLLSHLLHGLPPTDVVSYVVVTAVFLIVAFAACALPALRASRLDPMAALRVE